MGGEGGFHFPHGGAGQPAGFHRTAGRDPVGPRAGDAEHPGASQGEEEREGAVRVHGGDLRGVEAGGRHPGGGHGPPVVQPRQGVLPRGEAAVRDHVGLLQGRIRGPLCGGAPVPYVRARHLPGGREGIFRVPEECGGREGHPPAVGRERGEDLHLCGGRGGGHAAGRHQGEGRLL